MGGSKVRAQFLCDVTKGHRKEGKQLKIMDYTENELDRISELPPFIIHHIMSYLSTEEVARTSILSKRWNQLRTSFPILDFDQRYFTSRTVFHTNFCVRRKNEKFCQGVKRFINFVDTSLHRFCDLKLSIQKFRLFISLLDVKESSSNVDKWIGLVVENGVKELDFDVISDKDTVYTLPRTLFSAELLTTLKLVGCRLEQPFDTTSFRSLKKLTLERVCLNEQMVQKLTSECLVLEDLCFSLCWGLKRLSVSKALKLKKLKFHSASDEPGIVEIVVPSLQQLILQFSRVTKPRIVDIARSPHLKKCELFDVLFTDHEFNNLISKFPMLEALLVRCCDAIERIAISNDQLRDLHFFCCNSLKAVDADTPNLLSFTYDKNPIPHISLNAACPWRVSIESKGGLNTRWLLKAKEFLSVSSDIEILELTMTSYETSFNLDELRENSPSFPFQVGNLHLLMDVPPSDYEILLDGVFWICYPKTLSLHNWDENDYKFIQWFYDQLQNRNVTCCNSRHVKCWRHYLKNTKFESFKQGYKVIDIDNLMEGWPMLPTGCLQIGFDWGFPLLADK